MPVDLRSFRQSEDQASFQASIIDRKLTHNVSIHEVLQLNERFVQAQKERALYVSLLRKEATRDKEHLIELDKQQHIAKERLEEHLIRLPNRLDSVPHPEETTQEDNLADLKLTDLKSGETCNDPFFNLGCYDEHGNLCILNGLGLDLISSVQRWFTDAFIDLLGCPVQRLEVPPSMELSSANFHDCWGCEGSDCPACFSLSPSLHVPSWVPLLLAQFEGKPLFERQLPACHLLVGRWSSDLKTPLDGRDEFRLNSWYRGRGRKPWYRRLAALQPMLQLLIVTGPSLGADSRPIQQKVADAIVHLYQQLVPAATVTVRPLPPSSLTLAESSRFVIESYLPSQGSKVCLGYISNFQEYMSTNIRHGITKERLHVLHGVCCSVPETMEWMLRNSTNCESVRLPKGVRSESKFPEHLPFVRKVVKSKNGKKAVKELNRSSQHAQSIMSHPTEQSPTAEEIRLECKSCPFDFLPFYLR